MTTVDLDARRAVWIARSDLWLDTEVQPSGLDHVVRQLAASPYSAAEIRAIA